MRLSLQKFVWAGIIVAALQNGAWAQNLLVNGDFEFKDRRTYPNYYPSVDLAYIGQGETVPGWTFGSTVDLYGPSHDPQNGSQYLDLVGGGPLGTEFSIEQSFASTPGETYSLSFYYASHEDLGAALASFTASIIGGSGAIWSQTFSHTGDTFTSHDWTFFTMTFAADSPTTILRFLDTSNFPTDYNPSYTVGGSTLDNLVIAAVPEPGGIALAVAVGGVCIGPILMQRARRRRGCL